MEEFLNPKLPDNYIVAETPEIEDNQIVTGDTPLTPPSHVDSAPPPFGKSSPSIMMDHRNPDADPDKLIHIKRQIKTVQNQHPFRKR